MNDARKIRLLMSLRRSGVTDTRVLAALERVARDAFIPPSFADKAWDDVALPIGHAQTISQPLVVALMSEALQVGDRMKVLEVGTGSGYQTAVLSHLARRVYTIETIKPLLDEAVQRLEQMRITNITTRHGDGSKGWPEQAPFDRILVTAAAGEEAPPPLLEQLAIGGILVTPVTWRAGEQIVVRVTRTEDGYEQEEMFPVRFVPLVPG
ncbi:protein-L-isoaspartate O-methyltransferase [Rhodospirillales bacterium TMPK1]|uniref:Protein-L-isoaspartate O-methyltransferase n=2 Tax=Roseiterribacter gracilis TaxID=2812848 RepID=A0A8S8X8Q3_9PROT|nr:protein-L-isoaspartate O-methyltransferase [Rhodospirillales bacterium TMPK1]